MVEKIRAVRGAISVDRDDKEQVIEATARLIKEMLAKNDLAREDLVSIVFTATPDIRSEFPAAAARSIGISDVPLLCAREMDVEGAIPKVIRVMMHVYTERDYTSLRHVYLKEARQLRTDLPE